MKKLYEIIGAAAIGLGITVGAYARDLADDLSQNKDLVTLLGAPTGYKKIKMSSGDYDISGAIVVLYAARFAHENSQVSEIKLTEIKTQEDYEKIQKQIRMELDVLHFHVPSYLKEKLPLEAIEQKREQSLMRVLSQLFTADEHMKITLRDPSTAPRYSILKAKEDIFVLLNHPNDSQYADDKWKLSKADEEDNAAFSAMEAKIMKEYNAKVVTTLQELAPRYVDALEKRKKQQEEERKQREEMIKQFQKQMQEQLEKQQKEEQQPSPKQHPAPGK